MSTYLFSENTHSKRGFRLRRGDLKQKNYHQFTVYVIFTSQMWPCQIYVKFCQCFENYCWTIVAFIHSAPNEPLLRPTFPVKELFERLCSRSLILTHSKPFCLCHQGVLTERERKDKLIHRFRLSKAIVHTVYFIILFLLLYFVF